MAKRRVDYGSGCTRYLFETYQYNYNDLRVTEGKKLHKLVKITQLNFADSLNSVNIILSPKSNKTIN